MPDDTRHPALIIQTGDDDHQKRPGRGGAPKAFGDVEQARQRFIRQIEDLKDGLLRSGGVPATYVGLARLKYAEQAIAKSHRATEVFTDDTCPVIGDQNGPGELLILVSPPALDNLAQHVRRLREREARHLTGIETLELVDLDHRFPQRERAEVTAALRRDGTATLNIRVPNLELFSDLYRAEVEERLFSLFGTRSEPYVSLGNFALYSVSVRSMDHAMAIADLYVIDRLELMPMYFSLGVGHIDVASLAVAPGAPLPDLPIVAIVDSGIEKGSALDELIWRRDLRVPTSLMDTTHGTAVAALVASGGNLTESVFTPVARLLDATIMPAKGGISQADLVDRLEELLDLYSAEVKEWNLSLGRPPAARPTEFSDLGKLLDLFHKRYGVQFFFAAGNCDPANRRMNWPPPAGQELNDYVSAPGDAVCGITVGSCAPSDTPKGAAVPPLAPSPYSGRGPVASGIQKPDLTVPEGNLMPNGDQVGMPTLRPNGDIRTDMAGTSFAVPIVSGTGAELRSCLALSTLAPGYQLLAAKTLLLHHAIIPVVFSGTGVRSLDYFGYGRLGAINDMLESPVWRSTSLIIAVLYPDTGELVIDDLPYPDGLRTADGFRGRVLLTAVSDPLLDPSFKVEYVRSNVDVHLSIMRKDDKGKLHPQPPADYLRPVADFESGLIKEQHKWSPVKQFRSLSELSCAGESWQLRAKLILRDVESTLIKKDPTLAANYGVPVVIAITIEDPARIVNVSTEMFLKWRARGFVTEEVPVQPTIRNRLRGA